MGVVDDDVETGIGGGGPVAVATVHSPFFFDSLRPDISRGSWDVSPVAVLLAFDLLVGAVLCLIINVYRFRSPVSIRSFPLRIYFKQVKLYL